MSYLKDVKDSLKNIDELCYDALKEDNDYPFYINENTKYGRRLQLAI